jgi:hypothetical protein
MCVVQYVAKAVSEAFIPTSVEGFISMPGRSCRNRARGTSEVTVRQSPACHHVMLAGR